MENIESYKNENYRRADDPKLTSSNTVKYLVQGFNILFMLSVMLITEPFYKLSSFIKKLSGETCRDSIENQIALVTGGANGLGRSIAFRLAKEKCNIAICDVNYADAQKTAAEIAKLHDVKTAAFMTDVSDPSAIKQLRKDIEKNLGPVDILVNNAGILPLFSFRECTDEHLQKFINVNLTSHFWTARTFIDGMIERKYGKIVAISSNAAKLPFPLVSAYNVTKLGVKSFMDSLYQDLCCYGYDDFIKLTTVFPHFINTRKELTDILDEDGIPDLTPRLNVEEVANEIVVGMMEGRHDVSLPFYCACIGWFHRNFVPRRVEKYTITKLIKFDVYRRKQEKMFEELKKNEKFSH